MNISASIRKLTILFVVLFIALSGGLVYWQVAVSDALAQNPHNVRHCLAQNTPMRGKIFDRNGVLLAYSEPDNNVCGGYIRKYTDPGLAGLIGYYVPGLPSYPTNSVEAQYDNYLMGEVGSTSLNNAVNKVLHTSPVGNNIYLTIDERIQKIAEQEYNNYTPDPTGTAFANHGYPTYQGDGGSVVISDPKTGELLAMVSAPGFDPNKMVQTLSDGDQTYYDQLANDPANPLLSKPTQGLYSPGSTFKSVTLLAGLDSGATTLNQQWDKHMAFDPWVVPASDNSPGTTITGDNLGVEQGFLKHFPVSTAFGYANSDNIMFAHIGDSIGQDKWLDYTKKLYLDQDIPSEIPIAKSSVMQSGDTLDRAHYLNDVYGQGVDNVTPFQMSMVDNAIANNGVLMRPMFFTKITDANGNPIQTYSPQQLSTVASKDAAFNTRVGMNGVTTCGSAWHITEDNRPPTTIIGKTGTAQLGGDQPPHGWMITQAPFNINNPDQVPDLTIVGIREKGGEGAYTIGPAIWRMYTDIFNQNLVKTQLAPWLDPNTFCIPNGLWQ
jgi:cell division protein FtsI/penicillin-binding protein 2